MFYVFGLDLSFIFQLTAIDRDIGVNSNISYSIASGSGGVFTIDKWSGIITTSVDIDREKLRQYVLGVRAADGKMDFSTDLGHNVISNC